MTNWIIDPSANKMITVFNPENKEILTYQECLGPAMQITEQGDADQYLQAYIKYTERMMLQEARGDDKDAAWVVKQNIGYFAGYYNNEVRERVERLFQCSHPLFGTVEHTKKLSMENKMVIGANSDLINQG